MDKNLLTICYSLGPSLCADGQRWTKDTYPCPHGAWRGETDETGLYFKAYTQTHKEIHVEEKVMNIMN